MNYLNKKYFNNIVTSYALMSIQIIIPILLVPYMLNKLDKDLYGIWVLFNTIIGYFGLTGFGFGTTFLKEVSKNNNVEYISKYLTSTLLFYCSMIPIALLLFLYLYYNLDTLFIVPVDYLFEAKIAFIIFFFVFSINFIFSLFGTLLFAKEMLYIQNYIAIVSSIITAVLISLVLFYNYSLIALALVNLFMTIVTSFFVYYVVKKNVNFKIAYKYFDLLLLKKMIKPSFHYFIITASAMIVLSSDNIVISSFIGVGSVTLYAIGYKLVSVSQNLLFKIVDIMIPDISRLYHKKKYNNILKLHNKMLFLSIVFGMIGYGFLAFYGIDILNWWVGTEYVINYNIFLIFIIFGILHAGVHVSAIFLVAMGEHKGTSYMTMLDAFLNIVFSIIFLHYYGLFGVALGTLVAHMLTSAWFTSWWFYRKINIGLNEKLSYTKEYKGDKE